MISRVLMFGYIVLILGCSDKDKKTIDDKVDKTDFSSTNEKIQLISNLEIQLEKGDWSALVELTKIENDTRVIEVVAKWYFQSNSTSGEMHGLAHTFIEGLLPKNVVNYKEFQQWWGQNKDNVIWDTRSRTYRLRDSNE